MSSILYRYLTDDEYKPFIQTDNLTAILQGTSINLCEAIAVEEIKTYVRQRYDVEIDFRPVLTWSESTQYKGLDRVNFSGVVMVFPAPQPIYDNNKQYVIGDKIYVYGKGVYNCIKNTLGNPYTDTQYWAFDSNPSYPANTLPTLTDDRNLQSIMYCIDISLYHLLTRIAPRNIPQHRIERYSSAITWLKSIARGEVSVSMTLLQPESGSRIVWGSDNKDTLDYQY